jgi:hypothetical protein
VAAARLRAAGGWARVPDLQERMNVIHKEALCINCGCCVSECNAMESDPEFLGPQALAKGMRFVGDPATQRRSSGSRSTTASTASGTARAASSATSAARRASTRATRSRSSAPVGQEESTATWARSTQVVRQVGRDDGLAARTSVPDAGRRRLDQRSEVRLSLAKHGKVPPPFPPHVAWPSTSRATCTSSSSRPRGAAGIVQGRLRSRLSEGTTASYGEGRSGRPTRGRREK